MSSVALLAVLTPAVPAEAARAKVEARRGLSGHGASDRTARARREEVVVDLVAIHGVLIHEELAVLLRRGRAFAGVGVVRRAHVVAEFVRSHQMRFQSDEGVPGAVLEGCPARVDRTLHIAAILLWRTRKHFHFSVKFPVRTLLFFKFLKVMT